MEGLRAEKVSLTMNLDTLRRDHESSIAQLLSVNTERAAVEEARDKIRAEKVRLDAEYTESQGAMSRVNEQLSHAQSRMLCL
jgi:chromosome segregation ATPase